MARARNANPSFSNDARDKLAAAPLPYKGVRLTLKHLQAIGRVTAEWAFLEVQIDFTLSSILEAMKRKPDRYLAISFKKRIRLWRDIVAETVHDEAVRAKLVSIIDRAASIYSKRNIIVHGTWRLRWRDRGLADNWLYDHGETFKVLWVAMNAAAIEGVAREIAKTSADLTGLVGPQPYFLFLPPSRKVWRTRAYRIHPSPAIVALLKPGYAR